MNKIQAKKILFLDPSLRKTNHIKDYSACLKSRSFLFAKYFPKYLRDFDFRKTNLSIKSKMKRIKILKNFRDSLSLKALEYRLLSGSQVRFIKTLHHSRSPDELIEKIKLFANLKSIKLYFGEKSRNFFARDGIEGRYLIKALAKIKLLRNIESLEFKQMVNSSASLIHAIDDSPRLLHSLKTLAISSETELGDDDKVLETLKDCKNILKNVTSLSLPALRSPSHLKSFQSLENSCPNLKSLSFEFASRDIIYNPMKAVRYSERLFPVEINYLSAIESFQNLRSLRLHIADTFTFLKDFTPPPLIQDLLLNFEESLTKEMMTRIDKTFTNQQVLEFFETNPTLVRLYDAFQSLQNLQTLKIFFSSDVGPEEYQYHNYLSQGLTKRISSLNKLTFVGAHGCWDLNKRCRSSAQDFYLPEFLKACHPSTPSLQTLEIGYETVIFSNFNLFSSRNKFLNLSTITLTGAINKNDSSNTEIGIFLKQVMTLGLSITTIKLHTFVHATVKSLLSLLQQLNQLKKPENLYLKLQIKFYGSQNLEDLGAGFEGVIKELRSQSEYSKLHGVSLLIYTDETKHAKEFLDAYGKKFDSFKLYTLSYSFGYFD